jgi:hypothetical protein
MFDVWEITEVVRDVSTSVEVIVIVLYIYAVCVNVEVTAVDGVSSQMPKDRAHPAPQYSSVLPHQPLSEQQSPYSEP